MEHHPAGPQEVPALLDEHDPGLCPDGNHDRGRARCRSGIVWEGQFKAYTRQNMQALANSAAESISTVYQREGSWDGTVLAEVKNTSAMSSDVGIQIIGPDARYSTTTRGSTHASPLATQTPSPTPRPGRTPR